MGTDLSKAKIRNDRLVCPYHSWEFGADGQCLKIPSGDPIPASAAIQGFPVQERQGLVFVYNSPKAAFDLPFFEGENPGDFISAKVITFRPECSWEISSGNAFDLTHFEQVHGRQVAGDFQVTYPHPLACRIQHRFKIIRPSWADRLLILLNGREGKFDYTSWRGNFVLLKVTFNQATNYLQIIMSPDGPGRTKSEVFVLQRRGVLAPYLTWLKRYLTYLFFRGECKSLRQVEFNQAGLLQSDSVFADYIRWLRALG